MLPFKSKIFECAEVQSRSLIRYKLIRPNKTRKTTDADPLIVIAKQHYIYYMVGRGWI